MFKLKRKKVTWVPAALSIIIALSVFASAAAP
jgi:hypothetical protein